MSTSTRNRKNRVNAPQSIQSVLGPGADAQVDSVPEAERCEVGEIEVRSSSLKGRLAGRVTESVSVGQMDEAIALESAVRHGRAKQ